jgi:tRNA pseudouridine38-40 synthase
MHRNVRLLVAYDGTDFHGWQTQPGLRTVQDLIEQAVRRVVRHQVTVIGSGRTDSGVHAAGQVANFITTSQMPAENLRKAIGSRLPKDVSVYGAADVPLGFRATRDAVSKQYRYTIHNDHDRPVRSRTHRYAYHFWHPLDVERMQSAADHWVGRHDFAAFASSGHGRESTIRTVLRVEVSRRYDEVYVDVEGSGFLYNQVRNMVGTLIEIGRGHWAPQRARDILESLDRSNAGPTAPARGLCLQWVRYDLNREYPLPPQFREEQFAPLIEAADPASFPDSADLDESA